MEQNIINYELDYKGKEIVYQEEIKLYKKQLKELKQDILNLKKSDISIAELKMKVWLDNCEFLSNIELAVLLKLDLRATRNLMYRMLPVSKNVNKRKLRLENGTCPITIYYWGILTKERKLKMYEKYNPQFIINHPHAFK